MRKAKYIPLIIVAILSIYYFSRELGSFGMMDIGIVIIMALAYIIAFIALTVYNIIKIIKKKEKFDFIPIIITFIIPIAIFTFRQDIFKSKTILNATSIETNDLNIRNPRISLNFRKNNRCYLRHDYIDFVCISRYNYKIKADTIVFDKSIVKDSIIFMKYFINDKNKKLLPVTNDKRYLTFEITYGR